jgi:hypothetical protein
VPPDERAGVRRRLFLAAGVLAVALPIVGCGGANAPTHTSSTHAATHAARAAAPPPICRAKAKAAILRVEHIPAGALSTRAAKAGSGYPECVFTLRMRARRPVRVTVEVDTAPQAYAVLERSVDEAVQIWPVRFQSPPQHIDGLGIDADWFPEEQHLMTTDAVRLITATVDWPRGTHAQKVALAVAAARPYLGPLQLKLARGPAP